MTLDITMAKKTSWGLKKYHSRGDFIEDWGEERDGSTVLNSSTSSRQAGEKFGLRKRERGSGGVRDLTRKTKYF